VIAPLPARVRYDAVAMSLHWLIAALLVANIVLAWYFNTLVGLQKIEPTQLHKSIGITILLLSVLRLAWRIARPPPPLPAQIRGWERFATGSVHLLFYVVMLGMPLTGWAFTSASRLIRAFPITLYGLAPWPAIGPLTRLAPRPMHQAHRLFLTGHVLLADLAYALIALHVAAAVRHQFIRRDGVAARMVPFLGTRPA